RHGRRSARRDRLRSAPSGFEPPPCLGCIPEASCGRPGADADADPRTDGDADAHADARADADAGTVACTTLGPAGHLARVTQRGIDEHSRLIVVIRAACSSESATAIPAPRALLTPL